MIQVNRPIMTHRRLLLFKMKSILSKLHLRNRHQAAAYGVARGLLPRPRRRG